MAKRIMVPSRDEKEEFCCEGFEDCPYYKEQKDKGKEGACRYAMSKTTEDPDEKE